jgi:ketosteroid isomerase-like protein
MEDFDRFIEQRKAAADAYVSGDPGPLGRLVAEHLPATFFHPMGDVIEGAKQVAERYKADAGAFEPGSKNELEILQSGASGDIGFWTGYQVAEVHFKGRPEPVPMRIRITEIFRREHGAWKLVHRHADLPKRATG